MTATTIRAQQKHLDHAKDSVHINGTAVAGTIGAGIATGLWTWAAIAAFSAGPVGWTIAGVFFSIFAFTAACGAISSAFMIFS